MDIKISPSMLASDFANLEAELKKCDEKLPLDLVREIKQSKKFNLDKIEQKKEFKLRDSRSRYDTS